MEARMNKIKAVIWPAKLRSKLAATRKNNASRILRAVRIFGRREMGIRNCPPDYFSGEIVSSPVRWWVPV